jgi:myo-inositol-1(or 4)-monophosphatase
MSTRTPNEVRLRREVACAIARSAGRVAARAFRDRPRNATIEFKGRQDYLSATDADVERLIRDRIAAAFPDDLFFGEENGGEIGDGCWVCDPIDGTGNFVRGIPAFCISLAFVQAGRIEVGIVYDPIQDELFEAERGGGAFLNGERLAVSGLATLDRATVEAGWSTRLPMERYVALLGKLAAAGAGIRRGGSGTLGVAYVAAGRLDAYCELHINAWDVLAGLLLVQEAGGWTNDFLAGDGLAKGNPVLACTPALRHELTRLTGIF